MKKYLVKIRFFDDMFVYREGLLAQGFWALQIYRLGHLRYSFKTKIIRFPMAVLHLLLLKISEMFFGISIGVEANIGRRLVIEHFGSIIIHGKSKIGNDCIIRQGVTIGNKSILAPFDAPSIGDFVNIGAGAKVLGNVKVGNNVSIGANAVVIYDVPDNHIAVGIPAKNIPINRAN